MTFVAKSHTWDVVPDAMAAREAGALVGRFHAALEAFEYGYRGRKGKAHDTARHLTVLAEALQTHRTHRHYDRVATLAESLIAALDPLPDFSSLPMRNSHGDLKISNLLFDEQHRGLCLVDLDTIGLMVFPHEMGDALRSWCNPAGEDFAGAAVDIDRFRAAVGGYAQQVGDAISPEEYGTLVTGYATICMELTARFLADTLNERYFGFNATRYATRGDHNLARSISQWNLARSVLSQRVQLEDMVTQAFTAR
jgi:Ser/Thr protein kinase RdoA (MazF antagonist)